MGARLRSWWPRARKPLEIFVVIVGCILVIALLVVSALAYIFNVNIPGLRGKTLWDWLQLLIIPAVLAVGGCLFNYSTSRNERNAADRHNQAEREIAQDNQREAALQEYIDKISELLLHEKLRESQPEDEVRTIARVRTLTTLPRLEQMCKMSMLQFLHESKLIEIGKSIISLSGANLSAAVLSAANLSYSNPSEANLRGADLSKTDLRGANLSGANLSGADISWASLRGANLRGADLRGANLSDADLSDADLCKANITPLQLDKAQSLKRATTPDGSKHP